jgi:diguanylate cyclase (GGDEF)-like protein
MTTTARALASLALAIVATLAAGAALSAKAPAPASRAASSRPPASSPRIALTPAQARWIADRGGRVVSYCYHPAWPPFDFRQDGAHRGLFKDYLDLLSKRAGLTFEPRPTATWADAIAASRRGDCDIVSGLVKTPEREAWLAFTAPYYRLVDVLVAPSGKPYVGSLASLDGQTLAGPADSAAMQGLAHDHPGIHLRLAHGGDAGLSLLLAGEVDAVVLPLDTFVNVHDWQVHDLKVIGQVEATDPISVGVRRDAPELLGILDAAVASLNDADRASVSRRWQHVTVEQKVDRSRVWAVAGAIGLLLLVSLAWNERLRPEIARREDAEAQLRHLAQHDALTGLPTMPHARECLTDAMARSRRRATTLALMFVDLDDFKGINDRLGHGAGDELLRQVAARLRTGLREVDVVARIGGDEFLVLLEEVEDGTAALRVALKLLVALKPPIMAGDQAVAIGASIGIALYPGAGETVDALVKRADAAMYDAKRAGKNQARLAA